MAQKFRTKSVYSKSGFFNENLSVGCDSLIDGFGLVVSGVDFLVTGADIYFDNRPIIGNLPIMLSGDAPRTHDHDERYYTETEIEAKLLTKQAVGNYSNIGHTHDASSITGGVLDPARIPVFSSTNQIVSTGDLSVLGSEQQAEIDAGTVVVTADGYRYIYKGNGAKTIEESYILLADVTPHWNFISDKPSWIGGFNPETYTFSGAQVEGLAKVATSASYNDLINKPEIPTDILYSTTIADSVVSVAVGGASATQASFWKQKTVIQVLDEILFPTINPSIKTAKSASIIGVDQATLEVGTLYSRTLTAGFNQGLIKNGNGSDGPALVGAVAVTDGYTFSGTGITSAISQNGNTYTLSSTNKIVEGSNIWSVTVQHAIGTGTYTDNKGVSSTALNASRVAGSSSANTSVVTGVYPYFYLKSSIGYSASAFASLISAESASVSVGLGASSGNLRLPYNLNGQYFYVAYPVSAGQKTKYATHSQLDNAAAATDAGSITFVFSAVATISITRKGWTKDYYIHVMTGPATNSNPYITLS